MSRARGLGLLAVAVALAGAPPPPATGACRGPAAIKWEEGGRAASDTWTQDDGCPARTAATETVGIDGPREVAWRFTPKGEVEGEPLAWKGRTVVFARAGAKLTLHVLETGSGADRGSKTFDTPL